MPEVFFEALFSSAARRVVVLRACPSGPSGPSGRALARAGVRLGSGWRQMNSKFVDDASKAKARRLAPRHRLLADFCRLLKPLTISQFQ